MTEIPTPPTGTGPLGKREARLAWGLLFPTIAIVSAVVILPLLSIFWISFKPIGLADLRPPAPVVREALRGSGEEMRIEYRVRNSSQSEVIGGVTLSDTLPGGVDGFIAAQPMGRVGTADEIAQVAAFLGSDFAGFINGAVIPVDGGIEALLATPQ